jgi:hypothetical protein
MGESLPAGSILEFCVGQNGEEAREGAKGEHQVVPSFILCTSAGFRGGDRERGRERDG